MTDFNEPQDGHDEAERSDHREDEKNGEERKRSPSQDPRDGRRPSSDRGQNQRGSGDRGPRRDSRGDGDRHRGNDRGRDGNRGRGGDRRRGNDRNSRYTDRRSPLPEDDLFRGRNAASIDETQFKKYYFEDELLRGIAESGYSLVTPLQEKMIMPLMERNDMIAQATGGTGKTASYLIPLLHNMSSRMGLRMLIITPTRDHAIQVFNEVRRLCCYLDKKAVLIDPGSSINLQAKALDEDPEIVLGTPGRLLDHIRRSNLEMEELDCLVLDEVDRLFDHGQRPDVESIVKKIYRRDQTVTLSSTISPPVLRLCRKLTEAPVELFAEPEKPTIDAVQHAHIKVDAEQKIDALQKFLQEETPDRCIIFCRTKVGAARVTEHIKTTQGGAMELHMGIVPRKQVQIIRRFREKEFNFLVTTDTYTRDLDVENITHIINFDIPEDPEDYIFRIGRTARLGSQGLALTLVTEDDKELLAKIEKQMGGKIDEKKLAGLEERVKPASRPRVREEPKESPPTPEHQAPEPDQQQSKPMSLHGGWHRKRTGRRR